jgi:hypothetical protein
MKINLAVWDRVFRFFIGVFLSAWAIAGGPTWAYFGIYLILSASWGLCPIYSLFKIRTAKANDAPIAPE